jgi:hypothetical protein
MEGEKVVYTMIKANPQNTGNTLAYIEVNSDSSVIYEFATNTAVDYSAVGDYVRLPTRPAYRGGKVMTIVLKAGATFSFNFNWDPNSPLYGHLIISGDYSTLPNMWIENGRLMIDEATLPAGFSNPRLGANGHLLVDKA